MSTHHSASIDKWEGLPRDRLLAEFSLWSADLLRLEEEIRRTDPFADLYHVDVSDGHATRALLFFPDLVERVRSVTSKLLHVHLEVDSNILLEQIEQFAAAGADIISVGIMSSGATTHAALERIRQHGKLAGLVIDCETPPMKAEPYLPLVHLLTLMGTAIGVKGQSLMANAPGRLRTAREMVDNSGLNEPIRIAADGAIRQETVPLLRFSGADTVVMGSLAFRSENLAATIAWLHGLPPFSAGEK